MTKSEIKREILIDEPSAQDLFYGKGHERTAKALARAIAIFYKEDRAIGLDGPWGSGKSSIVEIAERELRKSANTGEPKFHFFTYDIWKSQGSVFRRSFLEHFLSWAKSKFPKELEQLEEIEQGVKGKTREIRSNNQAVLDWYGVSILLFLPFLPIYYFWAKSVFDDISKKGNSVEFLSSWPFIILLLFVFLTVLTALSRYCKNRELDKSLQWPETVSKFRLAISQTLLVSARHYEDQKVTQHIREVDPNDFEFQSTFRKILSLVQVKNERVVVVLDNIDRLPHDEITEYWALARSVFSQGALNSPDNDSSSITAIVPYDRHLIESTQKKSEDDLPTNKHSILSLSSREVFSKTFDEILSVAPPVMSNSRDFFLQKIGEALPSFSSQDDLFKVYLIFNKILQKKNGTATPRQIISFINELTGLYVLHAGRYRLPTVAVYIAYQDVLEADPPILSDALWIDTRLRTLAADEDLERNLAAMIFNVEPDLAFQLLLDGRIKDAASSDAEELISLAKSPGFDLRVNDVILNNVNEWQSGGEFGSVVENFASLAQIHEGNDVQQFSKSLVIAAKNIDTIELTSEDYSAYLSLFDLCDQNDVDSLTKHLINCILRGIAKEKTIGYQEGVDWITFLNELQQSLDLTGQTECLGNELAFITLPSEPNFLFGVACSIANSSVNLAQFKKISLDLSGDNEGFLNTQALGSPHRAALAFSEFKAASLVTDDQWVQVANSLLNILVATDVPDGDKFSGHLQVLSNVYTYIKRDIRTEVNLQLAFGDGQFYRNVHGEYSSEVSSAGLADALFLASAGYLESGLGVPAIRHPNGQLIQDNSAEFIWFNEFFAGLEPLSLEQYKRIAVYATQAFQITAWLKSNQENEFVSRVMKSAFSQEVLPWINLSLLLNNYAFLKGILEDEFIPMLSKFEGRIAEKDLSALKIEACPVGVLTDAHESALGGWQRFHLRVDALLQSVPTNDWKEHFRDADQTVQVLLEKISTSGHIFKKSEFRNVLIEFILDVLNGNVTPSAHDLRFDGLMIAVDENYHSDIFRKVREDIHDVTVSSLENASRLFPDFISNLLGTGDRITKKEKDNVVRHLLCSALEGDNRVVLQGFLALGRNKIADFIKNSEESTQKKKDGSWNHFSEICQDTAWGKQVGEMMHGKRKARTIFNMLWGIGND